MKLLIYAFLGLILAINIQSQTYNVSVNEDGASLTIFNNINGNHSLDNRINLIDSSFNFILVVSNDSTKTESATGSWLKDDTVNKKIRNTE